MDLSDQYNYDFDDSKQSLFARLEGCLASLELHSYGESNRFLPFGHLACAAGSSATKLSNDDRHPNLDMVLETDRKIIISNASFPFMDDEDDDAYRDTTFGWLMSIYHDDASVDDLSDAPPEEESRGYDDHNNKENQRASIGSGEPSRKKRTYELTRIDDHQALLEENDRRPLEEIRREDWSSSPVHPEIMYQPAFEKKHPELFASTSTGNHSSSGSSSSTATERPKFIRSLSPPLLSKAKDRAS